MSEPIDFVAFVKRVRAGDPEAAAELVRDYESAIRVAVKLKLTDPALRRRVDSDDVCQSVLASFFVRAAAGQYDLSDPAQLVSLLVTMARNKVASEARRQARECRDARRGVNLSEAAEQVADGPGPCTVVTNRELLQKTHELMTPEERDLADRRAAGQGWDEIAAALGGTAQARRKQFERALDRALAALGVDARGP
jgi:DNA-directed RNA polymerase specialized sigma24 family protein